jgi:hypothetical protein
MLVKETAEKWLAEAKADMHSQMNFAVVLHHKRRLLHGCHPICPAYPRAARSLDRDEVLAICFHDMISSSRSQLAICFR